MPPDELRIATQTVADQAYQNLRHAIVAGVFRPGDTLREQDLVGRLGISRTPIREALQRLSGIGMVELVPRSGAKVRVITLQEADELHEVRRILEGQGVALAAQRADAGMLDALWAKVDDSTTDDGPTPRSLLINQGFHEGLAIMSGNRRLARLILNTIDLISLWRMGALDKGVSFRGTVDEHRQILEAVQSGDAELARRRMEQHIDASWQTSRNWATNNKQET